MAFRADVRSGWADTVEQLESLRAVPGMTVGRALRLLEYSALPYRFTGEKNELQRRFAEHLKWPRYKDGTPLFRIAPLNNHNALLAAHVLSEFIVPTVIDRIVPETQAVIELGCGYARHLFCDTRTHRTHATRRPISRCRD